MICPHCESPFTRIEPNTAYYTCHNCGRTFGYVVGSHSHCPRCNSEDVTEKEGYLRCNNDDCRFVVCLGYDQLDPETDDYGYHPPCGTRFQFRPGEPVRCPNCNPFGAVNPVEPVACAFTSEMDDLVAFPQSVIFPERDGGEFFRNRTFDL